MTIVLAIIIFIVATIITSKGIVDSDFAGLAIFMFLYSASYSLPIFLIVTLIHKTALKNLNLRNIVLLSGIAVTLMLLIIFIIFGKSSYDLNGNYSAISFSVIFTISIILSTIIITQTRKIKQSRK